MSLYTVTVALKGAATALQFTYRGKEKALTAYSHAFAKFDNEAVSFQFSIMDDFGRAATIDPSSIAAVLMADVSEELEGSIELGLAQARAQKQAQTRAEADTTLNRPSFSLNGATPILKRGPTQ